MFDAIINPIFAPFLALPPFWSILLISLLVSVIVTVVYKYMTDQELMKTLKADMKAFQAEMKKLREHPEKLMKKQKEAMEKNMQYMMHSMKPTLITFIPIILIFGWMHAHLAYQPISPGEEFLATIEFKDNFEDTITISAPEGITILSDTNAGITDQIASWKLSGDPGEYFLTFEFKNKQYTKKVIITEGSDYEKPVEEVKDEYIKEIKLSNEKVKPFGEISIFGWTPGWLASYIVFSIVFSIGLRKLLKVH